MKKRKKEKERKETKRSSRIWLLFPSDGIVFSKFLRLYFTFGFDAIIKVIIQKVKQSKKTVLYLVLELIGVLALKQFDAFFLSVQPSHRVKDVQSQ